MVYVHPRQKCYQYATSSTFKIKLEAKVMTGRSSLVPRPLSEKSLTLICESGLGTRLSQVWLFKVDNLEYTRWHHHTYSSFYSPYYACAARSPDRTFHAHRKNGSGQLRRLHFTLCGNDQQVKWTLIGQY